MDDKSILIDLKLTFGGPERAGLVMAGAAGRLPVLLLAANTGRR